MLIKGLIFAAGIGSRLRPLTDKVPKALVEVGGMTMLERNIRRLADAGITDITVNVHHHAAMVREWMEANAGRLGVHLRVSDESELLLDTGGGLLRAFPGIADADAIILHNADIYTDLPLRPMIEAHFSHCGSSGKPQAAVTLAVAERTTSRYLLFDADGRMQGWQNVNTGEVRPATAAAGLHGAEPLQQLGFLGIHIVTPALVPSLKAYAAACGEVFSLTPFYTANVGELDILGYRADGHTWIDIGRPETLARARAIASGGAE